MRLAAGTRLGPYEIQSAIGAGGMGEVYRARDTRLDRTVAIKVLPPQFSADPERRRRFIQEAKAASALQHPNIITVHDIAQVDGLDFIVMEYVAGKTLDALIPSKGMRLSLALKYAVQVADALARAHGAGIIHRDLKPSNVMVDEHGLVKVLDFGLAKLAEAAAADAETATMSTGEGVVLGTAAYMSPEQGEGKHIDSRSDVFSFGSMLYEMLTGHRAFQGDTAASTIALILREDPRPISQVAEGLPRDAEKIVRRCLRKDPEHRFQHMDDLKVALVELKEDSDSGKLDLAVPTPAPSPLRRSLTYGVAATALLLVAAVLAWRWVSPPAQPATPELVPLTTFAGNEFGATFSPDEKQVAYTWNGLKEDNLDIYVMLIGTSAPVRLTTDAAPDTYPAWSPDGRSIAFLRGGKTPKVMLMSALGGSERELAETTPRFSGIDWSPDGKYVAFPAVSKPGGLPQIVLLSPDTGDRKVLTSPSSGEFGDGIPRFSPDGSRLAFLRHLYDLTWGIGVITLGSQPGEARIVTPKTALLQQYPFAWTPDSRELVFAAGYQGGGRLWRMPADGQAPATLVMGAGRRAREVTLSRRGGLLAYVESINDTNIWQLNLDGGQAAAAPAKLIASTARDLAPEYSPDGRRIVFVSDRSDNFEIWVCGRDGSDPVQVTNMGAPVTGSPRWSPDGRTIAFDSDAEGQVEVYTASADGGPPRRLTNHPSLDAVPTWSSDGRWIYFTSDRSGTRQLWKMPAEGGDPVQITKHGGVNATESADSATLSYAKDIEAPGMSRMPLGGGEEKQFLDVPARRRWGQVALTDGGLYYIARDGADVPARFAVFFHAFASQQTTRIFPLAKLPPAATYGLALAPDGRSLLFVQIDASGSDLMLLENFR